ncbi:MAG TPA: DegT/DnrJ/EryC1/StrS family aminotransferase [Kofleriaceae bacterium]|nr:DegT/DnrJ/EryC1/StrS family aminotransferase [Kofleriaceae bacterium]
MTVPFVDLPALIAPRKAEFLAAIERVLDAGAFIGGPAVAAFEAAFAGYCGAPHAVAVRTGTDALVLALRALGIGHGDEVITAANSFFATAEAISHAGGTPVLADVDDDTLLIDPADVARRVTPRTRCIIPVHLFGQIADMAPLRALAAANRLHVLEDSAQAHGATRTGPGGEAWRAGSIAEVAAFSFYPTKNLGALGEGGAITTRDPELCARVQRLRDHGQAGRHDHVDIGYNARLDALQCACLAISLSQLDAGNAARVQLAARYRDQLAGVPGVRLIAEPAGSSPVHHLMVVRVDATRRDALRAALAAAGIATAVHYPRPIHLQPAYAHLGQGPGSCPIAERAANEMISLPMFPDLSLAQVDRVASALRDALARA